MVLVLHTQPDTLVGVTGNAPGGGAAGAVSNTLTSQAGAAGGAGTKLLLIPPLAPTSFSIDARCIIYMGGSFYSIQCYHNRLYGNKNYFSNCFNHTSFRNYLYSRFQRSWRLYTFLWEHYQFH